MRLQVFRRSILPVLASTVLVSTLAGGSGFSTTGDPLLSAAAGEQASDASQRRDRADIAKVAAVTRADHSTIFFRITGIQTSGYVRDGVIHMLALERTRSSRWRCVGEAVSRDGARLAYVNATEDGQHCRVVVLEIDTNRERVLSEIDPVHTRHSVLRWSWDDTEIVSQELRGIFAISTKDGRKRQLASLPLRSDSGTWQDLVVHSLDWLHGRRELVADASACVPRPGAPDCQYKHHVMLISGDRGQPLAIGRGAAVSPGGDRIAFVTKSSIEIIDANGSNRQRVGSVPRLPLFPWVREDTELTSVIWSPDGDQVWFDTAGAGLDSTTLYLVDVKQGIRRRVVGDGYVEIVAWR